LIRAVMDQMSHFFTPYKAAFLNFLAPQLIYRFLYGSAQVNQQETFESVYRFIIL